MPDKKLTDAEIVKALECCKKVLPNCRECPIEESQRIMCCDLIKGYAIDLINRLQADCENYKQIAENQQKIILDKAFENKKLKAENGQLTKDKENLTYSLVNAVGQKMTAKAEAYKEFAERLKTKASDFEYGKAVWLVYIDNLVKELVGEDNG